MKLTGLLQPVDKLKQAGLIDNLQQVCGIFDLWKNKQCESKLSSASTQICNSLRFVRVYGQTSVYCLYQTTILLQNLCLCLCLIQADAFLLAIAGGPDLLARTQQMYFQKKKTNFKRV